MPAFDLKSARHWAEELHNEAIGPGMTVIDATMGNGGDTERLCRLVGEMGRVIAFDVQAQAVERTRARLEAAGLLARAELHLAGHERVREFVTEPVDAAVFNLGWLPGGDKSVTTRVETTLAALDGCLALLRPHGLLTVCAYPGHDEGSAELARVWEWARGLDGRRFAAMERAYLNQPSAPPVLLAVQRLR